MNVWFGVYIGDKSSSKKCLWGWLHRPPVAGRENPGGEVRNLRGFGGVFWTMGIDEVLKIG